MDFQQQVCEARRTVSRPRIPWRVLYGAALFAVAMAGVFPTIGASRLRAQRDDLAERLEVLQAESSCEMERLNGRIHAISGDLESTRRQVAMFQVRNEELTEVAKRVSSLEEDLREALAQLAEAEVRLRERTVQTVHIPETAVNDSRH